MDKEDGRKELTDRKETKWLIDTWSQSYKASTIVIFKSRVINLSNLLVITTVES